MFSETPLVLFDFIFCSLQAWTDVSQNTHMREVFNQPYVLLPDGNFRVYLDMLSVVFLLYTGNVAFGH